MAVSKDEENQSLVPSAWRQTIAAIVDALEKGDFFLGYRIAHVRAISVETAEQMKEAVHEYGDRLACLSESTWGTSACQWMCGYWDVVVDLATAKEGQSDLVLALRVFETCDGYDFVVQSIHVP